MSTDFIHCTLLSAGEQQRTQSGCFEKLANVCTAIHRTVFKADGKEIRRSLETTDRAEARRKLAAEKQKEREIDRSQGKLTLRKLCDRYLKTIKDSKPTTSDFESQLERLRIQLSGTRQRHEERVEIVVRLAEGIGQVRR